MDLSFLSLPAYKNEQRLAKKRIDLRSTSKTLLHQRYLHKIFWWISKKIALRANNPYGEDSRVSNVMDVSTGTTELVIQVCYHLIRYLNITRLFFTKSRENRFHKLKRIKDRVNLSIDSINPFTCHVFPYNSEVILEYLHDGSPHEQWHWGLASCFKSSGSRKVAHAILPINWFTTQRGQALCPSDYVSVWKEAKKNSAK